MKPYLFVVLIASMLIYSVSAYTFEPISELQECAIINDKHKRFNCYEILGRKAILLDKEHQKALPKHLGGGGFSHKGDNYHPQYQGEIISCKKSIDKKRWFFRFKNGQIWKQIDNKRLSFDKQCYFSASIQKDSFGYVLHIKDYNRKIRITRYR